MTLTRLSRKDALELAVKVNFDDLRPMRAPFMRDLGHVFEAGEKDVDVPGKVNDLIAASKLGHDGSALKAKLGRFPNEIHRLVHATRLSIQPTRQASEARNALLIQTDSESLTQINSLAPCPVNGALLSEAPKEARLHLTPRLAT